MGLGVQWETKEAFTGIFLMIIAMGSVSLWQLTSEKNSFNEGLMVAIFLRVSALVR